MSQDWNGLDLVDELCALLGDTSTTFEARVLKWLNDIQDDICTRHTWPFLKELGQKVLTASAEQHDLNLAKPTAPTLVALAGGSLATGVAYKVLVTFYEGVSGVESIVGEESASITPATTNLSITATIPVSGDPLVTARRIYLSKAGAAYYLYSTVGNNTTVTTTITADVASTELREPPDYKAIKQLISSPFIQTSSRLDYRSIDQLRMLFQGSWSTGTPSLWSDLKEGYIVLYPKPSTALTASFYYYKMPSRIFNMASSQPTLPIWLKPVLKAGVVAMGYEYRDRDGQDGKRKLYEDLLTLNISRKAAPFKGGAQRVRDVCGDSDGNEI